MKQKQQILEDRFYEPAGITTLTVNNKYGKFTANAFCNEEDEDIKSGWLGIDICQLDIKIQTLHAKWQILRERANGMQQVVDRYWNAGFVDKSDDGIDIYYWLTRQAKIAKRDADTIKQEYLELKRNRNEIVGKMVQERRDIHDRIAANN